MKKMIRNILEAFAYMFRRKGFLTRKIVVATLTLIMMLYIDATCHIWDGMGLILLVLLSIYVIGIYTLRYMELKRIDEEQLKEKNEADANDGVGERLATETDMDMETEQKSNRKSEETDAEIEISDK